MKKLLLLPIIILGSFSSFGQVLDQEDFDALILGNIATDITGAAAGQGDYFVFASNGAAPTTTSNSAVSNVQIVADGNDSQGLQITGVNGDKGSRFMWKDGFVDLWSGRTAGNNIIELEVDINPGDGTSTSRNTFGVSIFNASGDRVLAGFNVRAATRELFFVVYSTPTGNPVGSYNYSLAAAPGIQLPADVFSRIGISYNKTTGVARIKGPGIPAAGLTVNGSATGTDPAEIDYVSFSGNVVATPNTSSATMVIDNLLVKASSTDTLLNVASIDLSENNFSIYPNPANNVINFSNNVNAIVDAIELFDINGRIVKSVKLNATQGQFSVSDLATGMYMVKISTTAGTVTKKIVKH